MARTIDLLEQRGEEIGAFYDHLATHYDEMTEFEKRFVRERPFFRLLTDRYRIRRALDAGSGTGFHSLLLSQLGVRVTAVDVSGEMLERLRHHAKRMELDVETKQEMFENLQASTLGQFDAIFCMGNSLAHLLDEESFRRTLEAFAGLLTPSGILFAQVLNYDRIWKDRERVQSIKETGNKTFVRFYDYREREIIFNLLTIDRGNVPPREELHSVRLRPVFEEHLRKALFDAGFADIRSYGSIAMEEFQPETSKDLVVLARIPEV